MSPGSRDPGHNLVRKYAPMQNQASIKSSDKLYFGREIVFRDCPEGWLVISVDTANWLVMKSDFQRCLLENFIGGKTVGEVVRSVKTEQQMVEFKALLAAIYAREFARTDDVPRPVLLEGYKMLNCYVTNACNLRCEHCFMRSDIKLKNELSVDEWKKVLLDFKDAGGENVTFTGGEPMMKIGFLDLVKYTYGIGLKVTVLSNGLLWDDYSIPNIAPYISEIQISIDGVDEESNAKVRGSGHFDKVCETVVAFANCGVRTSVATTFTLDNLSDNTAGLYKSMIQNIKARCNSPVFFKLSKKILEGRNTTYSDEQNKDFYQRIVEIENCVDPDAKYSNFMEGHTPNLVARNCGFGGPSIGADGEAYFCNRISEVESYGNVRSKSISELMQIGHKLHIDTSVDELIPCKHCHLRYICSGGCRIDECNFKGKLRNHEGALLQVKCSDENKACLERKLIESFCYTYKF